MIFHETKVARRPTWAAVMAPPSVLLCGLLAATSSAESGVSAVHEKLLALQTTASLLHVTAHPDDEHGGMLTLLARGQGVRVVLVSLTRGEAGANAIGPELFDGLGWIRAEELRAAGSCYGLDVLYFTRLADYGYSKRLSEAESKWGREDALRDLVYLIRKERPLVLVSRFQGNERDGHGQHQFAGVLAQEAFRAAGDPDVFPELERLGVMPWQPSKLYIGGVREDEDWNVVVDSGAYDPWLGDSYENLARKGLSFQRSQNSGRVPPVLGSYRRFYRRVASLVEASQKETGFFDGLQTSLGVDAVDEAARAALQELEPDRPESIVPHLLRGLTAVRAARENASAPLSILDVKERQFEDAIRTVLGIHLAATARPGSGEERTMGPVTPGDRFEVEVSLWNPSALGLAVREAKLVGRAVDSSDPARDVTIDAGKSWSHGFEAHLADDTDVFRPHVSRDSLQQSRYRGGDDWFLGAPPAAAAVEVSYEVNGVPLHASVPVERVEARLPYGEVRRELVVLPPISVAARPGVVVLPRDASQTGFDVTVEATSHGSPRRASVALELPQGFEAAPASFDFTPGRAEESERFVFRVTGPERLSAADAWIRVVARVGSSSYGNGVKPLEHRDLETRYLVTPAEVRLLPLDVAVPEGLVVGYVMGVGDEVPEGIEALGARVNVLSREDLAGASLDRYDAIVLGTRAYAVREDLHAYNQRLLDYVQEGGHLVVLHNTPEFRPTGLAPYPAELPEDAEEVSEEDAPVVILSPDHPLLSWPNRIGLEDFEGWVEQRGSKFWSRWDETYVPLVASHDEGQELQKGGWLTASYGKGYYTYFAYALHRQLPLGVPGAYRILANLLSLRRRS